MAGELKLFGPAWASSMIAATAASACLVTWRLYANGHPAALPAAVAIAGVLTPGVLFNRQSALRKAREELASSRADLQIVSDSVPQVLWQGLPDGRVTFMNLRWTEITGASVEEGLADDGWAWQNWFHPDDRQGLLDDWARARISGERFDSYRRLLHTDGTYRWLQVTARPVRNFNGEIIRWYGVSTDIHDEMQTKLSVRALNQTLEQRVEERAQELAISERRYRSMFEQSHVSMVEQDINDLASALAELKAQHGDRLGAHLESDPDLVRHLISLIRIIDVNQAAARLYRIDRQAVLAGRRPGIAEAQPFAEVLLAIANKRADGWQKIVPLIAGDGGVIHVICGVTVMDERPGQCRALSVMIDVTDREHTRELLLEAREELSRANRALTAGALSVSLAHDLGQPISAIAMDAAIGGRSLSRTPPDVSMAGKALDRVASSARRAGELLHRTRDQLARRDRAVNVIDLTEIVRTSISLLEHEARLQDTKIGLTTDSETAPVVADRIELQQVIINLLLNALQADRASPANERRVEVLIVTSESAITRTEVQDSGSGYPQEDEHRLFEPLYSTKPGSIGMGLAICRTIIEGFGGKLTARNNPDRGATFTFTLPASSERTMP